MARRPADYSAKITAEQERRRQRDEQRRRDDERRKKIQERQARAFGSVVLEAAATRFDVDQLAGLLLEALDRAGTDPGLLEVWRRRGRAFFRLPAHDSEPQPPATQQPPTTTAHAHHDAIHSAASHDVDPPATGAPGSGRDAPPRAGDLLDGLAPHRSGADPQAEA